MPRIHLAVGIATVFSFVAACQGQTGKGKQTPAVKKVEVVINGKKIVIDYRLPNSNGKQRFGDAVGYGKVWEASAANLTTEAGLKFEKCEIPAGGYTLFPLPEGSGKWTIIISKQGVRWDQSTEICREPFGKESGTPAGQTPNWAEYAAYVVRIPTQPFDLGFSLLRMAWLDDGVEGMVSAK